MIEELLPYYEKQLQEFGQQSREFSQKYPKIAQRLSLNQEQVDDPHIERLIQSFSLIAARIDKKLADSYDIFTRSLFEVMFPQYLKPPSEPAPAQLPRSVTLRRFRSTYAFTTVVPSPFAASRSAPSGQLTREAATTSAVSFIPSLMWSMRFQSRRSTA